jgi:hypothetical protein
MQIAYARSVHIFEVRIPDLADATVKPGRIIAGDAAVIGTPPHGDDLGTGMLAQADNFQPATAKEFAEQEAADKAAAAAAEKTKD